MMGERLFDSHIIERQWPGSTTEEEARRIGCGFSGDQRVYRFPNGFGASLVRICTIIPNKDEIMPYTGSHPVTGEPLWELAVVKFNSDADEDFEMCFDTPVADDVVHGLTDSEAESVLQKIEELPDATS